LFKCWDRDKKSIDEPGKIKGATRKAMQGMVFLHLRDTLQRLDRQHIKWMSLLTEEIRKAEKFMDKENLTGETTEETPERKVRSLRMASR